MSDDHKKKKKSDDDVDKPFGMADENKDTAEKVEEKADEGGCEFC